MSYGTKSHISSSDNIEERESRTKNMELSAISPPRCFFCKETANNTLRATIRNEQTSRITYRTINLCYDCTVMLSKAASTGFAQQD